MVLRMGLFRLPSFRSSDDAASSNVTADGENNNNNNNNIPSRQPRLSTLLTRSTTPRHQRQQDRNNRPNDETVAQLRQRQMQQDRAFRAAARTSLRQGDSMRVGRQRGWWPGESEDVRKKRADLKFRAMEDLREETFVSCCCGRLYEI